MASDLDIQLLDNGFRVLAIKFRMEYRRGVQKAMAETLTEVRKQAGHSFIPNITNGKTVNPYILRKLQPAHPSRLTNRTGKLSYMLTHDVSKWTGSGNKLVAEDSAGLHGLIRTNTTGEVETFTGTYRVSVKQDGFLSNVGSRDPKKKGKWMPTETSRTLAIRFQHETGIRGTARPFMYPAMQSRMGMLQTRLNNVLNNLPQN